MKKTGTKVLSVIMAILCLIPMLSISTFAAEEEIGSDNGKRRDVGIPPCTKHITIMAY